MRRTPFDGVGSLYPGLPPGGRAALLAVLKGHPSELLHLVGDIVDGWPLRCKGYWPLSHHDVVH